MTLLCFVSIAHWTVRAKSCWIPTKHYRTHLKWSTHVDDRKQRIDASSDGRDT